MRLIAIAVVVLIAVAARAADVPITVVQQGYLLDASDHPVESEAFALGFSIWTNVDSTDTAFRAWPATPVSCTTRVVKGFYAVALGTADCGPGLTTKDLPFGEVRYLEASIGGAPLRPRLRVSAVPAATVSGNALLLEGKSLADLDARYAQAPRAADAAKLEGKTLADLDARFATSGDTAKLEGKTLADLDARYARINPPLPQAGGVSLLGTFTGDGAGLTGVDADTVGSLPPEAFARADHAHKTVGGALSCPSGEAMVGFTSDGAITCAKVLPSNLPDADGDGTPDLTDGDADNDGLPNAIDPQPLFNPNAGTLVVRDGATSGPDLRYQYAPLPAGTLKANWDAVSGVAKYFVWVGTSPGSSDVVPGTDVGTATSFTTGSVSLQGAWTGAKYFVSVAAISAGGGALATGTSNGVQIAELATWNGATDAATLGQIRNTTLAPAAGYFSDFPSGSGFTQFYGAHYFENVTIPAGTVIRVSPFGKVDGVQGGVSATAASVVQPKDGWFAINANTITINGTIDAIGRGYGGGGGAPGCAHQSIPTPGLGGSNGLSGNGGRAGHTNGPGAGIGGNGREGGGGAGAYERGGDGTFSGGGGAASGVPGAATATAGGSGGISSGGGARGGDGVEGIAGGNGVGGGGGGGGYGAGGGGGSGGCGTGAGGGGTGGGAGTGPTLDGPISSAETGQPSTGGSGAGARAGAGGTNGTGGRRGGYATSENNGDSSTDRSFLLGGGGGGGGAQSCHGAGGGGAGGGAILLSSNVLVLGAASKIRADAAPGGGGAGDCNITGGGGGGAGGGVVLEGSDSVSIAGGATVRSLGGATGATGSNGLGGAGGSVAGTENGGTIKVFHKAGALTGSIPTSAAGRVFVQPI